MDQQHHQFLENVPVIITEIRPTGEIVYLNRTESGFTKDYFIGKSIFSFFPPEIEEAARKAIQNARDTGQPQVYYTATPFGEQVLSYENHISLLSPQDAGGNLVIFSTNITTQKQSELDLKLKEQQQSLILNSLPAIFYRVRPEAELPTVWISDQVATITGYRSEDFLNDSAFWESKIHPDDRNRVISEYRLALSNDTVNLEYRWLCADGTWHWFSDHLVILRDNHRTPVDSAGIWIDVSERKNTEEALKESEGKYRLLADNSADVIWIMSLEGKFTYCSPSIEKLRGYTVEEVINLGLADVLTPDSYQRAGEIMARVTELLKRGEKEQEPVAVELEQTCKDGSTVWTESLVKPIYNDADDLTGFLGVTRNISERRRSLEILEHAELKFRGLVEHAPDGVVLIDSGGNFVYASPASFRMMGYRQEELVILKPQNLTHPDDLPMVTETLMKLMTDPTVVPTIQYRFLHKNGDWIWIESTFSNLMQVPGIGGIVINFRDISQRKKDEEELIKARRRAEESDRLKSAFLANVSHEIRTPMNAIVGFSEMLNDDSLTPNERKRYTRIIQSRSDDLMHIINDLLEISRIESGSVTVSSAHVILNRFLDELYQEFAQKLRNSKKAHISLSATKPLHDDASLILTDPHILKQVFSNLIENAIKYTHQGSVEFGYQVPEEGVLTCYVKDTGIGISAENQQIIFQHFRRGDFEGQQQYSGTGLGLSICKGNLGLLGGNIGVESTPGKGSRFIFRIPYHPAMSKEIQKNLLPEPLPRDESLKLTGKKILVVEDEETNMEFLKIILEKTGAMITETYSGTQVRKLYDKLFDFDLALIDVRLPDASGWDLIAEIKKIAPELPVIAQTAYAMTSDRHKSEQAGCDGFIPKPIRKDALFELMHKMIAKKNNPDKPEAG